MTELFLGMTPTCEFPESIKFLMLLPDLQTFCLLETYAVLSVNQVIYVNYSEPESDLSLF